MIRCVFPLCTAEYPVTPSLPNMLIPTHLLKGPSWAPTMNCPSSLMVYPLSDDTKKVLSDAWGDLIVARRRERDAERERKREGVHWTGGGSPPLESQPLNGDHDRNAPGNHSEEWHLGGRADEEILPEATKYTRPPFGVLGEPMGRVSEAMATMGEVLSQAASAINAMDVSGAGLGGTKPELQRARQAIAEILGEGVSGTLQDCLSNLNEALEEVEKAERAILMAKELAETFSRNIQA